MRLCFTRFCQVELHHIKICWKVLTPFYLNKGGFEAQLVDLRDGATMDQIDLTDFSPEWAPTEVIIVALWIIRKDLYLAEIFKLRHAPLIIFFCIF